MTDSTASDPNSAKTQYISNPFALIRPGWEGLKLNLLVYIGVVAFTVGLVAAGVVVMALVAFIPQLSAVLVTIGVLGGLGVLAFCILKLTPAYYRLLLAMARQEKLSFKEAMNTKPSVGWKLFWTTLLFVIAVVVGLFLLVVPGIIAGVWFSLSMFVVVDEGLSGTDALFRSRELVRNRFWDALGAGGLSQSAGLLYVIPVLGPILVLVASFVLMPVTALRYVQLKDLKAHSDGKDVQTHPGNYAVLVLAFLSFGASYNYSNNNNKPAPYQLPVEKSTRAY